MLMLKTCQDLMESGKSEKNQRKMENYGKLFGLNCYLSSHWQQDSSKMLLWAADEISDEVRDGPVQNRGKALDSRKALEGHQVGPGSDFHAPTAGFLRFLCLNGNITFMSWASQEGLLHSPSCRPGKSGLVHLQERKTRTSEGLGKMHVM